MGYLPRLADQRISTLVSAVPAVLLTGPRGTGKTTTARRYAETVVRLDDAAAAASFHADPDSAMRGLPEPILLDEWQAVPGVLGAVKRAVDTDPRPGRFIVTGSVHGRLDSAMWPGTGRLVQVPMSPLTVREEQGCDLDEPPFLQRVAENGADGLRVPSDRPDLRDYLELALAGGFPEAVLRMADDVRRDWLESYVEQLLVRDVEYVDGGRDPERLRRYFEAYALNTAGVVTDKTLYEAAAVSKKTAHAYERLLQNLFVVEPVLAWSTNRLQRLSHMPKRYVVDSGLAGSTIGLTLDGLIAEGTMLGPLLDTFVTAQLRAELRSGSQRARMYHLRQEKGAHEVDLLFELDSRRIVGIEIKSTSAPGRSSARHLGWLRDELGERFAAGVVFHTGPDVFELDERIIAAPISTLWG